MHSYIDSHKLYDFSKVITIDDVIRDIRDKYNIQNIADDDDESLYYICKTLYDDYTNRVINYNAYIEKDMNARLLMELRKNAYIPFTEEDDDFYIRHKNLNTVDDVKQLRKQYIHNLNKDYLDLDWQYYYLVKQLQGYKAKDFEFDFENCFADGNSSLQTLTSDYIHQFTEAHTRH